MTSARKVLGLIGSPRRLGNSELIVKQIARRINGEVDLELIRLTDLNIKTCLGCYQCLEKGGVCVMDDDAPVVFDAICAADGVILAAPTYFLGAYGAVKTLVDRSNMILPRAELTDGKPAIVVTLAGVPGRAGRAPADLAGSAMTLGLTVKAQRTIYAALPGEVFLGGRNQDEVEQLAGALFDRPEPLPPEPLACPVCGSNAFTFIEGGVKCLVCLGEGVLEVTAAGTRPLIEPDKERFLAGKKWRLGHVEWLRGMKQRFFDNKKELKEIVVDYRDDGKWLGRPET
jgi:NAD(P)H-dependent FMN reductase